MDEVSTYTAEQIEVRSYNNPEQIIGTLRRQDIATTLGEAHPNTMITLDNLAAFYKAQGNAARAKEFSDRANRARQLAQTNAR